ncbi:GAF domain-containing sensor histidine kinase [Chromatiaceae bacterium AAb-1]|nr:GAF domain-containing sensor histidine kinase [Chromatiaceae bacterium AAb-1]
MQAYLQHILLQVSRSPQIDLGDLTAANKIILQAITQGLAVDRAGVWLFAPDNTSMHCTYQLDCDQLMTTSEITLSQNNYPRYFAALSEERNIVAPDAATHEYTAEFAQNYLKTLNIISMLDTPIRHHGETVGIICIEHRQRKEWHIDEVVFAGFLADLYGRALSAYERQCYQTKLEQLNSNLEQIINERTHELVQSLEQLRQAQQQLIDSEKMVSLGRMVAGIAHEINTPLGIAITANSNAMSTASKLEEALIQGKLSRQYFTAQGTNLKKSISLTESNLYRSADLVNSLKQLVSEPASQKLEWFNLSRYIPEVMKSMQGLLQQHNITLQLELPKTLRVQSYAVPVATILTRLVENACQHAYANTVNPLLTIRAWQQNQHWYLEVADNGRGMNTEEHARAFEPFFTTTRNLGTKGLGLTLVFNLTSHLLKGRVELRQNSPGSIVRLCCPLQLQPNG